MNTTKLYALSPLSIIKKKSYLLTTRLNFKVKLFEQKKSYFFSLKS